jgi:peptidoglycan/xylan/chitin deacetylase (PgdA/CDA1 family)
MYIKIKVLFLYFLKFTGVFSIARILNRHKIRIICYHGISIQDEHKFIPSNFITFPSLKKKISFLKTKDYNFISLDQAVEALKSKKRTNDAVVITFDDGFQTILDEAFPWLIENKIPTTAYITTYYAEKPFPIFRIAVQYLFWKSNRDSVLIQGKNLDLKSHEEKWSFILDAEKNLSAVQMNNLLKELQTSLTIKLTPDLIRSFSIITKEQIAELHQKGINIELHTHRHCFPTDYDLSNKEIIDNTNVLGPIVGRPLKHFCYPSGIWDPENYKVLKDNKVESATTCIAGLVDHKENLLSLPRIIESEAMLPIQFEAEVVGIGDWLRFFKK